MNLVILDGNAVNPGDLSWDSLKSICDVQIFDRTPKELVLERAKNADAIFLNKVVITEEILENLPRLKYIGVQATGYNVIDIEACKKHGVTVTNVPSYSTSAVAQMVFAFILEFASKPALHSASVMNGDWISSSDFCYWKEPLTELEGKTLGIYGYGSIGSRVAKIASVFGMKVIVCTRRPKSEIFHPVDFSTLLNDSDFVTLHVPLTDLTKEVINKNTLALMKKSAFLINTARGGLVNEKDLRKALDNDIISGYAADVVLKEPMSDDCPLLGAKNCIITPHIAWAATETRKRLLDCVIDNLCQWIAGKPKNVVS